MPVCLSAAVQSLDHIDMLSSLISMLCGPLLLLLALQSLTKGAIVGGSSGQSSSSSEEETHHDIQAARCYSNCLQLFIQYKNLIAASLSPPNSNRPSKPRSDSVVSRLSSTTASTSSSSASVPTNSSMFTPYQLEIVNEIAHKLLIDKYSVRHCLDDGNGNLCSRQCISSCNLKLVLAPPMSSPETTSSSLCRCKRRHVGCLLACSFQQEMSQESQSRSECPYGSSFAHPAVSPCPKICVNRLDCRPNEQCCMVQSCGNICLQISKSTRPHYIPHAVGPSSSANIEFDWSSTFRPHLNKDAPLVFVLQTRACLCHKFLDRYASPWRTLLKTHRLGATLSGLENGTIYRFRLAAVNLYNNGRPSSEASSQSWFGASSGDLPGQVYPPPLPRPPSNLHEHKWRQSDSDGFRFHVELLWQTPVDSVWRDFEYFMTWTVDHGGSQSDGEHLTSVTQFSKTIPGKESSTILKNLLPLTTYKIQMVTRAIWHGYSKALVSSFGRVLYITTPTVSNDGSNDAALVTELQYPTSGKYQNGLDSSCLCSQSTNEYNADNQQNRVKVGIPFILNGDLRIVLKMNTFADYTVEYYPEVCITQNSHSGVWRSQNTVTKKIFKNTAEISLTQLQHSCRYFVLITSGHKRTWRSVSKSSSQSQPINVCFCTPYCGQLYQIDECPPETETASIDGPVRPQFILADPASMTYKLSWRPSRVHPSMEVLSLLKSSRFRVAWAPRRWEPVPLEMYYSDRHKTGRLTPLMDSGALDVRIVPSNVTTLLLRNLTKETIYIVRIQTLLTTHTGNQLESQATVLLLPTLGYRNQVYPVPYSGSVLRFLSSQLLIFISLLLLRFIRP